MGEPVRIVDLARDMIRLYGYSESEIRIAFTGLRPGEKLYEEVLSDDELTLPTPHPKLRIARAREVAQEWLRGLVAWLERPAVLADESVRAELQRWVTEYRSGSSTVNAASPADASPVQQAASGR
jgi:FlaA1/EpsC-like NDP-sugar epimerase